MQFSYIQNRHMAKTHISKLPAYLSSSILNQVLGISIKKICLFSSKVVASLQWAYLVDAQVVISLLDNLSYIVKVGFIEGEVLA